VDGSIPALDGCPQFSAMSQQICYIPKSPPKKNTPSVSHLSGEILPNIIKLALNSRIMAHFPSETVIFNR
jgi:hypothetical protein